MKILIASDKFKDACNAQEVGFYLKKGIEEVFQNATIQIIPLADGGEGTLYSLANSLACDWIETETFDPLFRPIKALYLFQEKEKRAIIEMASASGFELLKTKERNAMHTTSFGTGLQILDAIKKGAKEIVITVGGTATNDAGIGIATALGIKFYDKQNQKIEPFGKNLLEIHSINFSESALKGLDCKIKIATDVENPFSGSKGAAHVFAGQKGANKDEIKILDEGLKNFAVVLENHRLKSPENIKGSGAGGGVAGGLFSLFDAEIFSAAEWILEVNNIDEILKNTDVLITGEGKVDSQTWDGKLISRLLKRAKKSQTKSIIVCGTLENTEQIPQNLGILNVSSIIHQPILLEEALKETKNLLFHHGILLGHLLKNI